MACVNKKPEKIKSSPANETEPLSTARMMSFEESMSAKVLAQIMYSDNNYPDGEQCPLVLKEIGPRPNGLSDTSGLRGCLFDRRMNSREVIG